MSGPNDDREELAYVTPRGFAGYAQVKTTYGDVVRVQQSSAAMAPHCWLYVDGEAHLKGPVAPFAGIPHGVAPATIGVHGNVQQIREIHAALGQWLDDVDNERV